MDEENIREVTVSVYDIDKLDREIWDFGTFIVYGNKEFPLTQGSTMEKYTHIARGMDADVLSAQEPSFTTQHTVYLGDYVVYVSTTFDNATHFLSPENTLYSVVERNVGSNVEETVDYIILKNSEGKQRTKKAFNEKNVAKDWTPVLRIE